MSDPIILVNIFYLGFDVIKNNGGSPTLLNIIIFIWDWILSKTKRFCTASMMDNISNFFNIGGGGGGVR